MKPESRWPANPGGRVEVAVFWGFLLKASIAGVVASLLVSALVLAIA